MKSSVSKRSSQPKVLINLDETEANLQFLEGFVELLEGEQHDENQLQAAAEAAEHCKFEKYLNNPGGFISEVLNEHLWSRQLQIAEAVRDHRRVAVPSCHDVGKSFIASRIAAWWVASHPPGEAFVVTTAPTAPQVRAILWREINRAHARGRLPGHTNQTEWFLGKELVAFGRKPADMDMTAFQGIHARFVLVIIDEACGVPKLLWDAADTLITNDGSRLMAIGNPDDPSSHFAEVCKPGSGFNILPISAFESPNFTDEPVPEDLRPLLVGRTWVEEKRKSWGEASPLWIAKVMGQFPEMGDDSLFNMRMLKEASVRELEDGTRTELGVDVARFGNDETVIYLRRGQVYYLHKTLRKNDLMSVCGAIVLAIKATGARAVKVDDIGLGGGVTDRLKEIVREERAKPHSQRNEALANCKIYGVNVGKAASSKKSDEKFLNLRAELYWNLRVLVNDGECQFPEDEMTLNQLAATKYEIDSKGRIRIEGKEDMKDRGLVSPDRADAIMLCAADCSLFDLPDWVTAPTNTPPITIFQQ